MPLNRSCGKRVWRGMPLLPVAVLLCCLFLGSCENLPKPMEPSSGHISMPEPSHLPEAPPLAESAPLPPPPVVTAATERSSVVVSNVPVQEILFALARDAKLNIEISPDITGTVTMNLIDQTLPEILDAISRQVDMRYELNGRNLSIMPDTPYLKIYQIDYPNVERNSENSISTSTNVAAIGQGAGGAGGGSGGNSSDSSIKNISNNHFWKTLIENIKDILRETDKVIPEGSSPATAGPQAQTLVSTLGQAESLGAGGAAPAAQMAPTPSPAAAPAKESYREAASVIANPESGTISVRATSRQHASVQEFIDRVLASARRQVLIEATIVEVSLSDQYQQGIDWSIMSTLAKNATGLNIVQSSQELVSGVLGGIDYNSYGAAGGRVNLSASLKFLETFGKLHVMSSPKLSVLNNQTSLLKVVDESVYFTIDVTPGTSSNGVTTPATYTSSVHTLPVGLLMYVTPQISNSEEVTLNLRPTISRITSYATDPNPVLKQNGVTNLVPQIQTREMESILRVRNGDIAVLGGLMQDTHRNESNQTPILGSIPHLGNLFKSRDETVSKSELVIFLRPVILNQDSRNTESRMFNNSIGASGWQQKNSTRQAPRP